MNKKEFSNARVLLGKTQKQMSHLLGTSLKAIESYEQGWRKIPVHIERQVLFLLALRNPRKGTEPCWIVQSCPEEERNNCPAWEFQCGDLCWFINGTICRGTREKNWETKMKTCRKCKVFKSCQSF
jgi:hypothetical protein